MYRGLIKVVHLCIRGSLCCYFFNEVQEKILPFLCMGDKSLGICVGEIKLQYFCTVVKAIYMLDKVPIYSAVFKQISQLIIMFTSNKVHIVYQATRQMHLTHINDLPLYEAIALASKDYCSSNFLHSLCILSAFLPEYWIIINSVQDLMCTILKCIMLTIGKYPEITFI